MRKITMELALYARLGIWGKLKAEGAKDLSDETLETILSRCTGGAWLPACAKLLRDDGLLELADEQPTEYIYKGVLRRD